MPRKKPPQTIRKSHLLLIMDEPVIAQRWAVLATGSLAAGVMISHALQITQDMQDRNEGWFAKTINEWLEEVGLSRSEQETARARLTELGLLEERRVGMPAHLEFRVNEHRIYEVMDTLAEELSHLDEEAPPPPPKATKPRRTGPKPPNGFPPGYRPLL